MNPTDEEIRAVMSHMGKRSGAKPKAGRLNNIPKKRQREIAMMGVKARLAKKAGKETIE